MEHVPQHVSTVERNDWNKVREPQQNVNPHQPEKEMGKQEKYIEAQ